jgi:hypothetical protein
MNWVWFVNGIQYCCFEHQNLNVAKQRLKAAKRLLNTEQSEVLESLNPLVTRHLKR